MRHQRAEAGLSKADSIVQFENVGLRYGTGAETLSDLSFSLREGGFYFLTGPSGAGKTSLLKLLYLALRPSRGLIRLFDEDIVTMPRPRLPGFRRRTGVARRGGGQVGDTVARREAGRRQGLRDGAAAPTHSVRQAGTRQGDGGVGEQHDQSSPGRQKQV